MCHDDFHRWRDSVSSSMLWVSANPGCGKSVLAKYLVDELKSTQQRTTCYFFFKDDFEDQRSAKGALSCILHQLFMQREDLLSAEILRKFNAYRTPRTNSYYDLWELWDILIMAAQEENAGEIICILDAFDECVKRGRQELAKILRDFYGPNDDTKRSINIKFLITSRPYDRIRQDLIRPFDIQDCPVIHLKGEGDAEVEQIAGEISLYIEDRVSRIRANLGLTQKEENMLLQGLGSMHNQTYLWVYLTLEWIENEINNRVSEAEIRNAISTLPRTVDEAYEKILSRSEDVEETKKLLHIVVAAERPLTIAEMELALTIREHHKSYEDLALRPNNRVGKYIRDLCGLFISITDDKVYLLHQTAKEFLIPNNNIYRQEYNLAQRKGAFQEDHHSNLTWKFSLIPSESHRILCKICIRHLLFTEFETRPLAWTWRADIHKYLRNNLFLEYSAKNWLAHFRASSIEENEILDYLQHICDTTSNGCLTWFRVYWRDNPDWAHIFSDSSPLNFTKLMIASYLGLEAIVKLELKMPEVNIEYVDTCYQRTALSWASENGFGGVVKQLIKGPKLTLEKRLKRVVNLSFSSGTNVNATDKYGRTPLIYAVSKGHLDIVQMLVKAGADVDSQDITGGTPISYALSYEQEDIANKLINELMRGAHPEKIRERVLVCAVRYGHEPIVKRLIDDGADTGVTDDENTNLVALAVLWGHRSIVKLLLEKEVDINMSDRDGYTPLVFAIERGLEHSPLVEMLLKGGAKLDYMFNVSKPAWTLQQTIS